MLMLVQNKKKRVCVNSALLYSKLSAAQSSIIDTRNMIETS